MTRTLLVIAALGGLVSLLCFGALHAVGGFEKLFHDDDKPIVQATRDLPWTGTPSLHIDHSAAVITYVQGPTPRVTVTGPRARIDALNLVGDTLTGANIHHSWRDNPTDEIHITITGPSTHAFFLSGAENLLLTNYDQDDLELHLSGAAHVRGVGKTKRLNLDVSGAGDMDLAQLPVQDARVAISGAGNATIDPKASADLSISGAGHIGLLTRPAKLTSRISGIGAVTTPDGARIGHQHDDSN
jgi:hypothetical protein